MTISYPRNDILDAVRPASARFYLFWRQEQSRSAGGVTRGKDLGPALWRASFSSGVLELPEAVAAEALLNSLEGVVRSFYAHDVRRPYPLAAPTGAFSDSAEISAISAEWDAVALSGLPPGFVISVGDYIAFNYAGRRALHQFMRLGQANGLGVSPLLDVRPHIRAGATTGLPVILKKPAAKMILEPDSVSVEMDSPVSATVSFSCIQDMS